MTAISKVAALLVSLGSLALGCAGDGSSSIDAATSSTLPACASEGELLLTRPLHSPSLVWLEVAAADSSGEPYPHELGLDAGVDYRALDLDRPRIVESVVSNHSVLEDVDADALEDEPIAMSDAFDPALSDAAQADSRLVVLRPPVIGRESESGWVLVSVVVERADGSVWVYDDGCATDLTSTLVGDTSDPAMDNLRELLADPTGELAVRLGYST
jgi:hypothetical protein